MIVNTKNLARKIIFAVIFLAAVIGFGIFAKNAVNKENQLSSTKAAQAASEAKEEKKTDMTGMELSKVQESDVVLGDLSAPVTLIEYASLSCPHCASFYSEAFTTIKNEYIDTKKVKFVYRDFPLNQPALNAAMVALCHYKNSNNPEKYHSFIKILFRTQESWAFVPDFANKLASIAKLDGMSEEAFNSCLKDEKLQESILKARLDAAKTLEIQSTPSFVINGELINGFGGLTEIKKIIDRKLAESKK